VSEGPSSGASNGSGGGGPEDGRVAARAGPADDGGGDDVSPWKEGLLGPATGPFSGWGVRPERGASGGACRAFTAPASSSSASRSMASIARRCGASSLASRSSRAHSAC
jgi:hypothetical protein